MKKILHIQLFSLLSGVQRVSLDELERLDPDKYEKWIVCKEEGPLTDEARICGTNVHLIPWLEREICWLNDVKALLALILFMRKNKFDIVHTHSSKTGVLGRLAAKMAGVKNIVHTVHGFSFPSAKSSFSKSVFYILEWIGARCATKLVCLNQEDYELCREKLSCPESKLAVIENGVDCTKFSPLCAAEKAKLKSRLGFSNSETVFVMVGRLWEQKDPVTLIKAFRKVVEGEASCPNIRLVYIGDGPLQETLREYAVDHGIDHLVSFWGWRANVNDILPAMDVFILPSLWEGMPLAIIEAMASGLPCIVSDIRGNNALVCNGKNGFLFNKGDELELSKLILLGTEKDIRAKMGRVGRELAIAEYSIDARLRKIESLYG